MYQFKPACMLLKSETFNLQIASLLHECACRRTKTQQPLTQEPMQTSLVHHPVLTPRTGMHTQISVVYHV